MPHSSNFEFLKEHDAIFFQLTNNAERIFAIDPNACLMKLCQFGESLAQDSATQVGVIRNERESQISHRVEELFDFADQIEQKVKNAQGRVNNLSQSILAKAFRGELATQWRADNPDLISGDNSAETLLAKIQVERGNLKSKKATVKKIRVNKLSRKKTNSK